MPDRIDEYWASRRARGEGQAQRVLCPFCGSTRVSYDEIEQFWRCLNKDCRYYYKPLHHVSGGQTPSDMEEAEPTDSRESAVYTSIECPFCNERANIKLSKKQKSVSLLFIPVYSSTKYLATCGNCGETFEIDEEYGRRLEEYGNF